MFTFSNMLWFGLALVETHHLDTFKCNFSFYHLATLSLILIVIEVVYKFLNRIVDYYVAVSLPNIEERVIT